ncbi:hypothetical protein [Streptomyces sp. TR06-5]|uniref:hypothetical protein n=1 Tax=Streptomyces sp. TR06-5 TaxID=3385976 RepID=UPI0039A28BAE
MPSGPVRSPEHPAPLSSRPALELLVHGVGGATPQEMLDDARTERVTGDHVAAVHRRAGDLGIEDRPTGRTSSRKNHPGSPPHPDGPRVVPEAYCWSHLTSGNSARALWLLLLPFMVVNLAHWMRPTARSSRGHRLAVRAHGAVVRLLALSLTGLLVAAACDVALDQVAWQCAGSPQCAEAHSWLGFLAPGGDGQGGWWTAPGRRLALAALLPTALTGLLWWLSHRTWSAYESQPPWRATTAAGPGGPDRPELAAPDFWYGRPLVARLRAAHTAAALLTVAGVLTAAAARHDRTTGGSGVLEATGWGIQLLLAAGGVWSVAAVCDWRGNASEPPGERTAARFLPAAAAGVLALAVVHAAWGRPGWESAGRLLGEETFGVLTAAQGALAAALAVIGRGLHRATRVPGTALAGLGPAATAMLACALGGVMSGGVAQWVAAWLDGPLASVGGHPALPGPPTVLTWQASVVPLLLLVLLALLCAQAVRVARAGAHIARDVPAHYPGAEPDAARSRRIGRAIAAARVTDSAPRLIGTVALATLLLGAAALCGSVLTGRTPAEAADTAPALLDGLADSLQAGGSWLMGVGFVLLLALGRRAYRDAATRRTLGILWDVGTFWPRAAHPFAPPCYAERAVPDLVWRMATWTRAHRGGRLVLSGHSQGSVLAAAAVWQLDPPTRRQVALLTYGSPLARLYGRWFPAHFGPGPLRALHAELDCWRNLWRTTDPIGGPVRLPAGEEPEVDRGPLPDPRFYGRSALSPLPAPVLGHSEYQADPAFAEERARLLERLGASAQEARTAAAGTTGTMPAQIRNEPPGTVP